jgi:hypothetical protein
MAVPAMSIVKHCDVTEGIGALCAKEECSWPSRQRIDLDGITFRKGDERTQQLEASLFGQYWMMTQTCRTY